MTINIDIQSDIERAMKDVSSFFNKDIPFTVAGALNDTAFDVRRRIVGSTFPKAFTVRNQRFPGTLWRVSKISTAGGSSQLKAFKTGASSQMTAMVEQKLDREYIVRHITGGTKLPRGSSIAIPVRGEGLRTKSGRIGKRSRPIEIVNRKDHFLKRDKSGRKRYIAKRVGGRVELVYVFAKQARIKKTFRFYEDAFDTTYRTFPGHWSNRMSRVIARSRFS